MPIAQACVCRSACLKPVLLSALSATHQFFLTAQACISHLRGLTKLHVADIGTPFEPASLDSMLAGLPALEAVSLVFREPRESELEVVLQDAFPCSLLRRAAVKSSQLTLLHRPQCHQPIFHTSCTYPVSCCLMQTSSI